MLAMKEGDCPVRVDFYNADVDGLVRSAGPEGIWRPDVDWAKIFDKHGREA